MQYKARSDWTVKVWMLLGIFTPSLLAFVLNRPGLYLVALVAAALVFGISYPQNYETRPDALIIKSGLTTRLITYDRIKGATRSKDGGVAIDYGIGNVLIAPLNPDAFTDDLAQHTPQLQRSGSDLVS